MTIQEQLNEIQSKMKKETPAVPEVQLGNKITYSNRIRHTIFMNAITIPAFIIAFYTQTEWLPFFITAMTVTVFIAFSIYVDIKFTNGDSYDKISENGIALALSFLALSILFIGVLQYAERFSPERINGEALQRIEKQIGELQQRYNTDTPQKVDTEDWDKGNTR